MKDLTVPKGTPKNDFSTWLGFKVQPSPAYPDRVFLAGTPKGVAVLEACHDDCYWAAKIRVDNFIGQAISRDRADARAQAERKLLEAMTKDPRGLLWISALNLFVVINPALITGDHTCQTLN
jgi:hypothetical protein